MPNKGYRQFVEKNVDDTSRHGVEELKIWKRNLKEMGIISKISMQQDDIEASIFEAKFQNINF